MNLEGQIFVEQRNLISVSGTDSSRGRKGEINLIITTSKDFFDKFVKATEMAKEQNLLLKDERITLFQKILYNNDPKFGAWVLDGKCAQ